MDRTELLKISKPILFNTEMVKAILDGRKTVTRRVVNPQIETFGKAFMYKGTIGSMDGIAKQSPNKVGDILYVRETWCEVPYECEHTPIKDGYITIPKIAYKADSSTDYTGIWKPSIHMPKEAARIFLCITDVRVERLQDITVEQAIKEGFEGIPCGCSMIGCTDCYDFGWSEPPQVGFMYTWDSTIKKQDLDIYGWNANPWVWVYEFERVDVDE